ncbi:MAG: TIGR01777 family oxidoreductase [Anaerolineales bacterium]|nr:TIGR01777 family oxidoreductase [Anaerolineales bacterium]
MRVIITGGGGLIGRELVASLAVEGHEIIVLSRNPARVTDLPSRAQAVAWDGRTAQGWGQWVDGAEAIVNLAGESIAGGDSIPSILLRGRWTAARKQAIERSRLNAGQAVVEAVRAAARKPAVVIQASAVGYYGSQGDSELPEDKPAGRDFLAQICVAWENATAPVAALGVRHVVARTGVVLSRQGGVLPLLSFPYSLFAGGPLGSGRQWFPWIHMDDEIGALQKLLTSSSAQGAYNLCAPKPLTNEAFGKLIGRALRRPHWMPAPAFALRLALGEIADGLLLTSQRQIPKRLQQLGYKFRYPEAETALQDLLR